MRYKDYEGPIEELVLMKLKEIEEKEDVKILLAVESGSRSWGFASPDSDYDVRFIYVRPAKYYLGLQPKKDFIDWELNDVLDINGWDLSKALQYFHKSNATLFEWSNSPIVYYQTKEWEEIRKISESYFSCKAVMYHYYGTANSNYMAHLREDYVKYKKYFYVLRPLLSCKWIEEKKCPPPVLFDTLLYELKDEKIKREIKELVEKKVKMLETDKGEKIEKIDDYIAENLKYYKEKAQSLADDRNPDWEQLNEMFLKILGLKRCGVYLENTSNSLQDDLKDDSQSDIQNSMHSDGTNDTQNVSDNDIQKNRETGK